MRQLNQQIQMLVEESAARRKRRQHLGGSAPGSVKKKLVTPESKHLGAVPNPSPTSQSRPVTPGGVSDTPKGRGRGRGIGPPPSGPSPVGPPPSKRPKKMVPTGRGIKKPAPQVPKVPGSSGNAVLPVTDYQSDEEDTAQPMSYDEKRQVSTTQGYHF